MRQARRVVVPRPMVSGQIRARRHAGEAGWYRVETPRPCRGVFSCPEKGSVGTDGGMTAQETIDDIRTRAMAELDAAASLDAVVAWERAFLGPKGELTLFLRGLASLAADQRPIAGRGGNALKTELTAAWSARHEALAAEELDQRLAADAVDVTLPGRPPIIGASHPVSQMIDELSEIFALLGFQTVFGPEVETSHYNFDLLNIPSDHPARDVWD